LIAVGFRRPRSGCQLGGAAPVESSAPVSIRRTFCSGPVSERLHVCGLPRRSGRIVAALVLWRDREVRQRRGVHEVLVEIRVARDLSGGASAALAIGNPLRDRPTPRVPKPRPGGDRAGARRLSPRRASGARLHESVGPYYDISPSAPHALKACARCRSPIERLATAVFSDDATQIFRANYIVATQTPGRTKPSSAPMPGSGTYSKRKFEAPRPSGVRHCSLIPRLLLFCGVSADIGFLAAGDVSTPTESPPPGTHARPPATFRRTSHPGSTVLWTGNARWHQHAYAAARGDLGLRRWRSVPNSAACARLHGLCRNSNWPATRYAKAVVEECAADAAGEGATRTASVHSRLAVSR